MKAYVGATVPGRPNIAGGVMKKKKAWHIAAVLLVAAVATAACSGGGANLSGGGSRLIEYKYEFFSMDTVIMLTLYADSQEVAELASSKAKGEFVRINDLSDRFADKNLPNPDVSDVYRINTAGGQWVKVSGDILFMVKMAVEFGDLSDGAFDVGLGAVSDLWAFRSTPRVPSGTEIADALFLGNYKDIEIDTEASEIRINDGVVLDLGGIAKGYATEMAAIKLREFGIEHGIINAGGNVVAIGAKPDGSPWNIGVRHPRKADGVIAVIPVVDRAVVTSGDYEKYFEQGGQRYHHILDPETGKPAGSLASVTILDKSSVRADVLSTACFVLGEEKARALLGAVSEDADEIGIDGRQSDGNGEGNGFSVERLDAIFISPELGISMTDSIADTVILLE
jgi:thiamine biosynthesis lipoprotein